MIKRSLDTLSRLCTLIRLILEYSSPVWGPHFALDQCIKVEKVESNVEPIKW